MTLQMNASETRSALQRIVAGPKLGTEHATLALQRTAVVLTLVVRPSGRGTPKDDGCNTSHGEHAAME